MSVKYEVEYHADGGQMCVPAVKEFILATEAFRFAHQCENEPGHTCKGPTARVFKVTRVAI